MMTSCPSFGHYKNYQVEHYFPTNFHCRVIKSRPSTALSLVSRLFRSCSLSPSILNAGRQLVILKCPKQPKLQKCYLFLIRKWNEKANSAIVTWPMTSLPYMWQGKIFYGKCYFVVVCHSSTYKIVEVKKLFRKIVLKDSGIIFMIIIIYFYNHYYYYHHHHSFTMFLVGSDRECLHLHFLKIFGLFLGKVFLADTPPKVDKIHRAISLAYFCISSD